MTKYINKSILCQQSDRTVNLNWQFYFAIHYYYLLLLTISQIGV